MKAVLWILAIIGIVAILDIIFTLLAENKKKGEKSMKFEVYKDKIDEWRWRLVAANGKIIADSGEGYHNKEDILHEIDVIKTGAAVVPVDVIE